MNVLVEDLEIPRLPTRPSRRKEPAQRPCCSALPADDLPQIIFDDRHLESASFTLNPLIDLDSLPFVDEKRDDVS